jgi:tetratricopeptide (TPR) repeat protein
MAENKDKGGRDAGPAADITIAEWNPDVPWLKVMKAATGDVDAAYVAQREKHGAAPSFYLDVAEFFFARKDLRRGLRVLSNLAELRLDEPALLRVMGHRLAQLNELDLAVMVFEQVKRLRPEEPQSFRDLGLVLGRRALELKTVAGDLDAALELLAQVIKRRWDRFEGIEIITLYEFNRLVSLGTATKKALPLDARFVHATPLDLRISMSWDADMTDMDIHVIEPSGEEAYYSYNLTEIGGRVSRDFTQGYGPETYSIRKAMKGTYKVRTKYFGSRAAALTGGVTLQVDLVTNWGRPNETRRSLSLRLTESKEEFVVGEIAF